MQTNLEIPRWNLIFGILSVDVVRPYISASGLRLSSESSFFQRLRDIRLQFKPSKQAGDQSAAFVQSVFEWVTKGYGELLAQHLYEWGQELFPYRGPQSTQVVYWKNIVAFGGLDGAGDVAPPPKIIQKLRAFWGLVSNAEVPEIPPTSQWDLECSRMYSLPDEPIDFAKWINAAIQDYHFRLAWELALREGGSPEGLEEVYQWGRGRAGLLEMAPELLGRPEKYLSLPPSLKPPARDNGASKER